MHIFHISLSTFHISPYLCRMKREDFEIMAPVGSRESLAAALQAGADSIYFGIERLNMRAHSASTFTIEDLREIASLCREHGVKSYLTVNTIIYGEDLPLMREILEAAKEAGISAVIASDVAVMTYARRIGVEVHLSTQLNISNVEALRFYAQFADVVVLARELNIQQVREIYDAILRDHICGPSGQLIRIEMFCHGALCMAVSGKCYLSLQNTGRSANRGECMQLCRRSYVVRDKETDTELEVDGPYIMSPKDLKTIRFLDKLVDAGVRVFKIEGRARGPEYVRTVVECYREAIELIIESPSSSPSPVREGRKVTFAVTQFPLPNRGGFGGGAAGGSVCTCLPIKVAAVDDSAAYLCGVTVHVLCGGVCDDVSSPLEGAAVDGGGKGVVDDEWHAVLMGYPCEALDVEHGTSRIGDGLAEHCLRVGAEGGLYLLVGGLL